MESLISLLVLIITCFVFSDSDLVSVLMMTMFGNLISFKDLVRSLKVSQLSAPFPHIPTGAMRINYDQRIRFWIGHKNSAFSDIHCSSTKIF